MAMRIISKSALRAFWERHPRARGPLSAWHDIVMHAHIRCFADVRLTFNSADAVGPHVVFNVNSWRVITVIHYNARRLYVRHVFTHPEYDRWTKEQR